MTKQVLKSIDYTASLSWTVAFRRRRFLFGLNKVAPRYLLLYLVLVHAGNHKGSGLWPLRFIMVHSQISLCSVSYVS